MEEVTLKAMYSELKHLHRDVEELKYILLPAEKLSAKETKRLDRIRAEMESGKEKSLEDVLKHL